MELMTHWRRLRAALYGFLKTRAGLYGSPPRR